MNNAGHMGAGPNAGSAQTTAFRASFSRFYMPVPVNVSASVRQYELPLAPEKLSNVVPPAVFDDAPLFAMLRWNGFAAGAPSTVSSIEGFYHRLKTDGTPVFVTSDSVLHLYHVQFDETLRDIEEREFHKDALALSHALYDASIRQAQGLEGVPREAALLNAAYFAVALECLRDDDLATEITQAREFLVASTDRQDLERMQTSFPLAFDAMDALRPPSRFGWRSLDDLDRATAVELLDEAARKHVSGARLNFGAGLASADADTLRKQVAAEWALIAKHAGFSKSPLFHYDEDYSQYLPRGHYTRSGTLKSYFKALMWFGRMTALIKGGKGGLVSAETARVQTTAAVLASGLLDEVRLADGRCAWEAWERIYAITAFYVGFADDLTPLEYRAAARKIYGERFRHGDLASPEKFRTLQVELARLRAPAIYAGTGNVVGAPPDSVGEDELLKALEKTKGFRLMGQRYVPDSEMLGKLTYPSVGSWGGGEFAFTTVDSMAGPIRGFPRGLDVMAVLGCARAEEILKAKRDDNYVESAEARSYGEALAGLRRYFDALDAAAWNQNLYWCWLSCLKTLLQDPGAGYPTFMQTSAWKDKQLHAALGSWSQLRHDTVLYAKQSYVMFTGIAPEPKMVEGYVEPVPELYARVLALTRMTRKGLDAFKALSPEAARRFDATEQIVERLLDISLKELGNESLGGEDYDFIRNFGERITATVAGIKEEGLQTAVIADVHTDANSGQVLQEATGGIRPLWVVYPMPDGGLVLGCGPAFSYYEFKQPVADRLTDELWREMLHAGKAPPLAAWTSSFGVGNPKSSVVILWPPKLAAWTSSFGVGNGNAQTDGGAWASGPYRLTIRKVANPLGFARLLESWGVRYLVREQSGDAVYKSYVNYDVATVLDRLKSLPCTFVLRAEELREIVFVLRNESLADYEYRRIDAPRKYDWRAENNPPELLGPQWDEPG